MYFANVGFRLSIQVLLKDALCVYKGVSSLILDTSGLPLLLSVSIAIQCELIVFGHQWIIEKIS